jgi:hypothetical protein
LMDGQISAGDGEVECWGARVDEAEVLRGQVLCKQLERLCRGAAGAARGGASASHAVEHVKMHGGMPASSQRQASVKPAAAAAVEFDRPRLVLGIEGPCGVRSSPTFRSILHGRAERPHEALNRHCCFSVSGFFFACSWSWSCWVVVTGCWEWVCRGVGCVDGAERICPMTARCWAQKNGAGTILGGRNARRRQSWEMHDARGAELWRLGPELDTGRTRLKLVLVWAARGRQ